MPAPEQLKKRLSRNDPKKQPQASLVDGYDLSCISQECARTRVASDVPYILSDGNNGNKESVDKRGQPLTNVDSELTNIDNVYKCPELKEFLIKQGMPELDAQHLAEIITKTSEKEFESSYLESLCQRLVRMLSTQTNARQCSSTYGSLTKDVRSWVVRSDGAFDISTIYQDLNLKDRRTKQAVHMCLTRLTTEGIIERHGSKRGQYRVVNSELNAINWANASSDVLPIRWPFDIETLAQVMPGNIIVVAGEPNAGKTAFLLNVIRQNMDQFEIHYFNSEMGDGELRKRLQLFEPITKLSDWHFHAWERSGDFSDVIRPGKGIINIIDFLELHEDFWRVGGMLKAIHDRLDGAVSVIALQKNKGADMGLGGGRSIEKARLYLAMEPGVCRLVKAKNWATNRNPNRLEYHYKLHSGCHFSEARGWHEPEQQKGR